MNLQTVVTIRRRNVGKGQVVPGCVVRGYGRFKPLSLEMKVAKSKSGSKHTGRLVVNSITLTVQSRLLREGLGEGWARQPLTLDKDTSREVWCPEALGGRQRTGDSCHYDVEVETQMQVHPCPPLFPFCRATNRCRHDPLLTKKKKDAAWAVRRSVCISLLLSSFQTLNPFIL